MTMFEITETGHRATDEAVAYWQSRELCPGGCGFILDPIQVDQDGRRHFDCTACGDVKFSLSGQS